jgi:hypothetical protein
MRCADTWTSVKTRDGAENFARTKFRSKVLSRPHNRERIALFERTGAFDLM